MLAHVSKAAFKNRGRPHVSRSSFSAAIMVSKILTLGSGWAESMYNRATEMKTLKFTISGCCIGNLKWRSYVASLSFELCGSERISRGQGGKQGGTGRLIRKNLRPKCIDIITALYSTRRSGCTSYLGLSETFWIGRNEVVLVSMLVFTGSSLATPKQQFEKP